MKRIRKNKKWIPALIIPIWVLLFIFELGTLVLLNPKPSVRRAWESAWMPDIPLLPNYQSMTRSSFRPRYIFYGDLKGGDLTGVLHFKPLSEELFKQYFEVDEYGFRNKVGTFQRGVTAVLFGTSHVAGSQQTQETQTADLLTNKYGIATYNYALKPLQYFWEDKRFQDKPPKYVIVLSTADNITSGSWLEELKESDVSYDLKKWQSYDEWWRENLGVPYLINFVSNYTSLASQLSYYSTTRYIANEIYRNMLNFLFSKKQLAGMYATKKVSYDANLDMLFMRSEGDDPRLTEQAKTDIPKAVSMLKQTRDILKSRGITLIMAGVPTKISLYDRLYRNEPRENIALVKMEEEMKKNQIEHIELYDVMSNLWKKDSESVYFKHDTHWNIKANEIITDLLAKKIKELDLRAK